MTENNEMKQQLRRKDEAKNSGTKIWIAGIISFIAGFIVCAAIIVNVMPKMMIIRGESTLGVDDTVNLLKRRIEENGWVLSDGRVKNMNKSLEKQGVEFGPKVRLVGMCHPDYAKDVLATDRYVSCLMPCKVAVWEGDDGKTYISRMNIGLMGKLFGGNIAKVMGEKVAADEKKILEGILK